MVITTMDTSTGDIHVGSNMGLLYPYCVHDFQHAGIGDVRDGRDFVFGLIEVEATSSAAYNSRILETRHTIDWELHERILNDIQT